MGKLHNIAAGVMITGATLGINGQEAFSQTTGNSNGKANIGQVQDSIKKEIIEIDTLDHEKIIDMQFEDIIKKYGEEEGTVIIRNHITIEINKIRQQYNIPEIQQNMHLHQAAQLHANYMHKNNILTHNEKNANARVAYVGYTGTFLGENISYIGSGELTINHILTEWKESELHFKNMILQDCVYIGFGAYGKYIVIDFGK